MKMIDNKLTSFHMSDNPAAYEVQRGNHFIFTVSGFDAQMLLAGVYESAAQENDYITEVADKIELSVDKTSIPMISVEEIEIKRGNSRTYLAGTPSYEEGKFDVNDYIGLATLEALMAWQRLVYDVTTDTIGRAKDCDIVLEHVSISAKHARITSDGNGYYISSFDGNFVVMYTNNFINKNRFL